MGEIDEDIIRDIIKERIDLPSKGNTPEEKSYEGILYDIRIIGSSIMFRLSPNGGNWGIDTNLYKMLLREKKLNQLL